MIRELLAVTSNDLVHVYIEAPVFKILEGAKREAKHQTEPNPLGLLRRRGYLTFY
jgi:hypothetical protein